MRNVLILAAMLCLSGALVTSCGGGAAQEKADIEAAKAAEKAKLKKEAPKPKASKTATSEQVMKATVRDLVKQAHLEQETANQVQDVLESIMAEKGIDANAVVDKAGAKLLRQTLLKAASKQLDPILTDEGKEVLRKMVSA